VQKVYLVFFDWDKYNITSEGQQIIALAAQQYKAGGSVRLQVTGYTDLSGSAGYNQRLSERRANAVASAMAALGVARSDMAVIGRGENDLRVPTADGVREPQNRRVEILFP
jgi:outer membrane protein OmpA-like peptidoglycan-associated protein